MENENYSQDVQQAVNSALENQKKKKRKKRLIILAVVAFLFIGIVALGSSGSSDKPESSNSSITTTKLSKDNFIKQCKSVAYKDIARIPDNYKGKNVKFTGKVIQVSEGYGNNIILRIDVTKDEFDLWDDTVYVTYTLPKGAAKILEDDIVDFYGICQGTETYETVLGSTVTIPSVSAEFIDIKSID